MSEPMRCLGFLRQDGSFPIILNQMNVLQFYLEVRSPRPGNMPADEFVTCFATALEPYGFQDFEGAEEARKEHLYEWLLERVLTFRAEPRWIDKKRLYRAHDVRVYPFDLNEGDLWEYEMIPAINPKLADDRVYEAMVKGLPLRGVYPAKSELPTILAYEEKFFGPFAVVLPNASGCTVRPAEGGFGQIEAVADGLEVINDETHWFVRKERYPYLLAELETSAALASLEELMAQRRQPEPEVGGGTRPGFPPTPSHQPQPGAAEPRPLGALPAARPAQPSEAAFLERLKRTAVEQGAYYRDEELINFHTSLKASPLVVLAGPSGLGKSSLIEIYQRALGLVEGDNFLWLAVRPNWNDDADLIGYYDPLNRLYRPGEAGLVDLLMRAQQRPDELFFVCFDEMNLAKVEHYFSQFLSNLERPEEHRYLRLYANELAPEILNGHRYPPQIKLGPNLLFAGTVNRDEAAHAFSDKVLDRANLIEMRHVNLSQWWQTLCARASHAEAAASQAGNGGPSGRGPSSGRPGGGGFGSDRSEEAPITASTWLSWQTPFEPQAFHHEVRRLEAINGVLGDKGFGYRVARQILLYLQYVPGGPGARPPIFDAQVAQRIIAPLRGSREELHEVCGRLEQLLDGCPASQAALKRKVRELDLYAFTS